MARGLQVCCSLQIHQCLRNVVDRDGSGAGIGCWARARRRDAEDACNVACDHADSSWYPLCHNPSIAKLSTQSQPPEVYGGVPKKDFARKTSMFIAASRSQHRISDLLFLTVFLVGIPPIRLCVVPAGLPVKNCETPLSGYRGCVPEIDCLLRRSGQCVVEAGPAASCPCWSSNSGGHAWAFE